MSAKVEKTKWYGVETITFSAGGYEAFIIPSIGGNLLKLKNTEKNINILRDVHNLEEYKNKPGTYGVPVLFPPNRIDKGRFKYNGKTYQFLINEPERNNSLHGFLETRPWEIAKINTSSDDKAVVELVFKANKNSDFYQYYPHEFICILTYTLSKEGLYQKIKIKNESNLPMPMGIGYHTAFNLEFTPECKKEDVKVRFSIKERIELTKRLLPTGNYLKLDEDEQKFKTEGQNPLYTAMDNHYNVKPIDKDGEKFHGAIIENDKLGLRIVYEVGDKYKHWMIWNNEASSNFVCIEPQTWMINAPNLNLPKEQTGYVVLEPNDTWSEETKIYAEKIN